MPCFGSCHVDNKKGVETSELLARGLETKAVGQTVVEEGLGRGLADGLDAYAQPPRSLREPTRWNQDKSKNFQYLRWEEARLSCRQSFLIGHCLEGKCGQELRCQPHIASSFQVCWV